MLLSAVRTPHYLLCLAALFLLHLSYSCLFPVMLPRPSPALLLGTAVLATVLGVLLYTRHRRRHRGAPAGLEKLQQRLAVLRRAAVEAGLEARMAVAIRLEEAGEVSDDSGTGRSTGLGSLSSSAPRYKQIR